MTEDTDRVSLSEAAQELIKATTLVGEASSQKDLPSMKEFLDAKINMVNENISQFKDQITNVNASIERQTKVQSLEWAIMNLDQFRGHSFEYHVFGCGTHEIKHDAERILLSFRQGRGCYIEDGYMEHPSGEPLEKRKSMYRDKVVNYIYTLTGVKP